MPVSHKGCHNRLIRETERTIKAYGMVQPGDAVLVGVSGGPDSVALLYVLNILAPRFSLRLGVAHLNHNVRKCLIVPINPGNQQFFQSASFQILHSDILYRALLTDIINRYYIGMRKFTCRFGFPLQPFK